MATRQPKVLRVGLVQGGAVVQERLLPAGQPVTLGSAPRNTFVVPGLPASLPLFAPHGDGWALLFAQGAEGRVQGAAGAVDLAALVAQGHARPHGAGHALPLRDDQRGKLVVGPVTVLWQVVAPPADVEAPALPPEAKGHRFRSLDRLFVTVLLASLALHVGGYLALGQVPPRPEPSLDELPARVARLLVPEDRPAPPRIEKERAQAAERKPEEKAPEAAEEKPAESTEQVAARKAARAAAVAKAVQQKGILKVLGSLGPASDGRSAVSDVFGTGPGATDVATALNGAGGVAVATDPAAAGGRKGGGQGGAASIGELATSGGGAVAYGRKTEVKVAGVVQSEGEVEVESDEIDQQKLAAFVRARMSGIKACYESALKRNGALKGKITVRFTILATGGLADVAPSVNTVPSADVAACIVGTMRGWKTPFHPSGPVTVEYPFVFSPVN